MDFIFLSLAMFESDLHHVTLLYVQFNLRCLFSSTLSYYLLLPWTKKYIFLSQQRSNLGHFGETQAMTACSCTWEETRLCPYWDRGLLLLIQGSSVTCLIEKFEREKTRALFSFILQFYPMNSLGINQTSKKWLDVTMNANRNCCE